MSLARIGYAGTNLPAPKIYGRAKTYCSYMGECRSLMPALSLIVIQMRRAGGARGGVGVNQME
jgi:hypothetical protein